MKRYKSTTFFVIFLFAVAGQAQDVPKAYQPITPKAEVDSILNHIDREVLRTAPDSALALISDWIGNWQLEQNEYAVGRGMSLKAWFFSFKAQYEESLRLAHQALEMQRQIGQDSIGIGLTLNRIGVANLQFERYSDAERYLLQALGKFRNRNDTALIGMTLNNLGITKEMQGDLNGAITFYRESLELAIALHDLWDLGYAYYNIAELYLQQEEKDSAMKYFGLAVEVFEKTEQGVPPLLHLGLSDLLAREGHTEEAIHYLEKVERNAAASGLDQILLYAKELLADVYHRNGQIEKAFQTQREYLSLKEETDSINNAARVAEIEERYKNAEKEAEIAQLKAENLEVENAAQNSRLMALYSVVGALIFGVGSFFFYQRRRQRQLVHQSRLEARMAEIKLIALRSRMNPHFIFNCINTTQDFVLNAEKKAAYGYLANFARLLRLVLENSDKVYIPLKQEIEQLQLYMELEKVRFRGKFDYRLEIDPELEDGFYEVPGMIVQPLVENAILHGLVNKPGSDGLLVLSLSLGEEHILCRLTDNGVGREKAAEIKSRKRIRYRSTALPNVRERLQTLSEGKGVHLQITDLFEEGTPAGTRVEIRLPFR